MVISIIALLFALLFPALRGAQARAKTVACAGNLREIGVAIRTWTGDHNGNFIGIGESGWSKGNTYGGSSLHWYWQLGAKGYLGNWVVIKRQHIDNRYGPNPIDMYRYPVLRCPGEPFWTESPWYQPQFYSGVPFNNYYNNYIGSSYDLNMNICKIVHCKCSREGAGFWCSRTYCPKVDDTCCAIGFSDIAIPGTSPSNALLVMDSKLYNAIGWFMTCMQGYDLGWWNDYGTSVFDPSDANVYSILNDVRRMHAFRHPAVRANGLFYDGHVDAFRPMERTPIQQRISNSLWSSS